MKVENHVNNLFNFLKISYFYFYFWN